jgi:hypothetical protein
MARVKGKVVQRDRHRLEVTIKNTKPVVLTDLTLSLLAIGHQYESFIENDVPANQQVSAELLVKEVRTGSIVFELVAHAIPIAPILWDGGSLAEWAKVAKDMVLFWLGKQKAPPKQITKTDLKQWDNILEPVARHRLRCGARRAERHQSARERNRPGCHEDR